MSIEWPTLLIWHKMDGHFDYISQVFRIPCLELKIFQSCLISRIWSLALKLKLCMFVIRNILAAIFNQAELVEYGSQMPKMALLLPR